MSNKAPDAEFRELTENELKDHLKRHDTDHVTNPPQAGREELPPPSRMPNFESVAATALADAPAVQRAAEATIHNIPVRAFFGGGRPDLEEG